MMHPLAPYYTIGYTAAESGTYFNKVLLVSHLTQSGNEVIETEFTNQFAALQPQGSRYVESIRMCDQLFQAIGEEATTLPRFPEEYFAWVQQLNKTMRTNLGMNSPDEWTYSFGWDLGEITCTVGLLDFVYELQTHLNGHREYIEQRDVLVKDIADTLFRFSATATLLGTNPATYFFWEHWKRIDDQLQPLTKNTSHTSTSIHEAYELLLHEAESIQKIIV